MLRWISMQSAISFLFPPHLFSTSTFIEQRSSIKSLDFIFCIKVFDNLVACSSQESSVSVLESTSTWKIHPGSPRATWDLPPYCNSHSEVGFFLLTNFSSGIPLSNTDFWWYSWHLFIASLITISIQEVTLRAWWVSSHTYPALFYLLVTELVWGVMFVLLKESFMACFRPDIMTLVGQTICRWKEFLQIPKVFLHFYAVI